MRRVDTTVNVIECLSPEGVTLSVFSLVMLVVYGVGLPACLMRYLINLANAQLTSCDWWINYTTAWRKASLLSALAFASAMSRARVLRASHSLCCESHARLLRRYASSAVSVVRAPHSSCTHTRTA